jgi:C4-dicarboxylate-specific signal transduction histidine kinase
MLSRQPLRRQILGAALLLLLPFVVAVFVSAARTREERRAEIRAEAASVSRTAAAYIDEHLSSLVSLASVLLRHPAIAGLDAPAATRLLLDLNVEHPLLTNLTLVGPEGRIIASGLPLQDGVVTQPWFQEAFNSGRPVVGEFTVGALSAKPIAPLAFPVRGPSSDIVGVLTLSVDLARLQAVLADIPLPDDSVIAVLDQGSRVLARTREPEKYVGTLQPAAVSPGIDGVSDWDDVDGIQRFHGDATTTLAPWVVRVGIPQSEVRRRLRSLWNRNIAIAGGALAGSMLVSLWLATLISRHIGQLRSSAQQIAAGNLSVPMPTATIPSRELADLQEAFSTMAGSLRETRAKLDHQFEQERLMNDALQSLQRQVVRQERLAAVGLLASGVAHELNNPLQAIVGAAQLLERQVPADAEPEVGIVKTQSARAVAIIRSLARFGSGQQTGPSRVSLVEVVEDVVRLQSPEADCYSIRLITSAARRERVVEVSFAEVEQVVLNFVLNAKHAVASLPPGEGRIEVQVTDVARWVRLEVRDNGSGVQPDHEAKLFQPFFTTKDVGEGTGLGLSVSYGIIHSHGGTIGYSQNEWGGATFYFELPCAEETSPDDDQAVLRRSL